MSDPLILIPARMASTRLPGKPLADIHGQPMIVHVWRRAMEAKAGRVAVAAAPPGGTTHPEVAAAIADQLKAKLTGEEQKAVTEKPTQNAAASRSHY